jgi:hypothetical protein
MSYAPQIFLDSGAFSAHSQGQRIDVKNYIRFIKCHQHVIDRCASLDVIPGIDGQRTVDSARLKAAAEESYRNHQIMKDAGLSPIPVVHHDDRLRLLEQYLKDGEPYIGLSPIKRSPHDAIRFLDAAFGLIMDGSGRPTVKTHGFGVTTALLCKEYPWTSIDSATWLKAAGAGQILVPIYDGDVPEYSQRPRNISISDDSTSRRNHVDWLPQSEIDELSRFLEEEVGVQLAEARKGYIARWRINITYLKGLEARSGAQLFFVSELSRKMRETLLQCGARCHLLSYYYLRQSRADALEKYVQGIKA